MKRRAFLAASAALPVTGAVAEAVAGLPAETTTADAELIRLGAELDRQWAQQKVSLDSGALDETLEALLDKTHDIAKRIEHIPATTWAGLRVKARAAM